MMKVNLKLLIMSIPLLFISGFELQAQSHTKITKCKDEKGAWHYGSKNLHKCSDSSKITTINDRGVRLGQKEKVKTKEELELEAKQKEKELAAIEKKKLEELEQNRILTVYQSEEDIEAARSKKMIAYDRKIGQHQNYINALRNQEKSFAKKAAETTNPGIKASFNAEIEKLEPKVAGSEKIISKLKQEKVESNVKFDEDLAFFRKNKG